MASEVRRRDGHELKRMKELEAENAKLKRMYADLALENAAIKDVLPENCNAVREAAGRRGARERSISCRSSVPAAIVGLSRTAYYRRPTDAGGARRAR